ncbi:protein MpRLK-Pelle_URK-1 [Marchantia polymorpha subsp. ruderalis]|uniref:Protein kinase domain-containing protein n=2 Tax=Marchantia polymorpha TaxID=3197 RepID=A0AAF6B5L1_MARPO|nr:hypothetical protein MARPO_0080s0031 [Marchantia polymorpha]BBN07295.1 hypothetical protein Mp_4g02680 [Marchantia polymorpha subsp. ruderalis]|eukprot:PTQ34409.1 hypothetical protein MARPO_0080s0031 [Marchantia polymorpha]
MDDRTTTVVLGVGIGITVCAIALLLVLLFLIQRKRKELLMPNSADALPQWSKGPQNLHSSNQIRVWRTDSSPLFRRFKLREVKKATNDFSTIIGRGGFGTVYKARFKDGLVAAVKRMNKGSHQAENDFAREMELLGRLHHRHLVSLRGFCAENRERVLVYDYMENGSLKEHLHVKTKSSLNWQTRMRIATGVAAALEYLHMYCEPPLCHRDIKSSNILLDENFVAKVADFGLAHAAPSGNSQAETMSTDVRGTPGYMDPEYLVTHELTEKSDVYSFGVLLLELITARRAVHEKKNLVEWAQYYMNNESRFSQLVDPFLESNYDAEELRHLISLIKVCTLTDGKSRPSMKHVVSVLYDKLDLERTPSEICITNSNVQSNVQSNVNTDMGSQRSIRSSPPTSQGGTTNRSYRYNDSASSPISPSISDRS